MATTSSVNGTGVNGHSTNIPTIITWDYQFAPNAQKARNLLHATKLPYLICEQPFMQPRPIMQQLGITYRRIPVNSIGKDVYLDNRVFLDAVQKIFPENALPTSPVDHAFESFGYRSFWVALPVVPTTLITPELAKERLDLFSVFSRPDFAELRPNALAELKSLMDMVETEFLSQGDGKWINGASICGVADIHAGWVIKWALETLKVGTEERGFGKEDFPKVHHWVEALPAHVPENEVSKVSGDEAVRKVLSDEERYAHPDVEVDETDPTGLKRGDVVDVETNDDAKPGNSPQQGTLIGLTRREIVIQLVNGLRLHFPRIGFVVKRVK